MTTSILPDIDVPRKVLGNPMDNYGISVSVYVV